MEGFDVGISPWASSRILHGISFGTPSVILSDSFRHSVIPIPNEVPKCDSSRLFFWNFFRNSLWDFFRDAYLDFPRSSVRDSSRIFASNSLLPKYLLIFLQIILLEVFPEITPVLLGMSSQVFFFRNSWRKSYWRIPRRKSWRTCKIDEEIP